jgi:hypothetical protein
MSGNTTLPTNFRHGRRRDSISEILTQIERVLDVNQLHTVSTEVVEAARDSLVIGQG